MACPGSLDSGDLGPVIESLSDDLNTVDAFRAMNALSGAPLRAALSLFGLPETAPTGDIAAHREIGGNAPDYLDPLDGPGWERTVLDHTQNGPMRRAQLTRVAAWQEPDWDSHMEIAAKVIEDAALLPKNHSAG